MVAGIARSVVVAAVAAPLFVLVAPSASADQAAGSGTTQPAVSTVGRPRVEYVDAPYIWINICLHIPTPGSATLNWCWP